MLGVTRNAEPFEIQKSFRQLSLKTHPDINPSLESEAEFDVICEAYDVLSHAKRRAIFDATGEEGLKNGIPGLAGFEEGYTFHGNSKEIFRDFFGGANPFSDFLVNGHCGEAPKGLGARGYTERDADVEHDLMLTLEDLYHGCTKKVKVPKRVMLEDGQTSGVRDKTFTINLKRGWREGTRITFPGEGDEGPNNVAADVVFIVKEKPHERFLRAGNDLVHRVRLPLAKALVGTTVSVETLDGRRLNIPVSEIVDSNSEKRIKGEGMPWSKDPSKKGDLVLRFQVDFPTSLSPDKKEFIKQALC